jgi:hypothetical protein
MRMVTGPLADLLRDLHACGDARDWAVPYATLEEAWAVCPRGDWMLWLAGRMGVDRKLLVLAACACARLTLLRVSAGETRPLIAIETAERWARGEDGVTLEEVRNAYAAAAAYAAADAAAAAAAAAAYAAVAYAAVAYAADAAYAAYAAADAAAAAAAAAAYAADAAAAADAADAAARADTLKQCADIVRTHAVNWPLFAKEAV